MIRRYCRTCGSQFMLDDNQVHTKCPAHRTAAHAPPSDNGKPKSKGKGKGKRKP